eukprot:1154560-Pelagomonas_calceolata.AAC.19
MFKTSRKLPGEGVKKEQSILEVQAGAGLWVQMVAMADHDCPYFCLGQKSPSSSPSHLKEQDTLM